MGAFPSKHEEPVTPPETKGEPASINANEQLNNYARTPYHTPMMNGKRQLDEFGRIVYDDEAPAPPIPDEEQAPFWDGWSSDKLGLNGEEVRLFRRAGRTVYSTAYW